MLQTLFDIILLPNKRSATIVTDTKRVFSKFGITTKVVSDNRPEYIGKDYKLLGRQWDFKHDSSIVLITQNLMNKPFRTNHSDNKENTKKGI